ncbi:MAG TPA: MarR family transcriptional regulator [Thermoanaerobaculia bacterium]|nr:MarR family transcriptional regulator [Thermoanaerobaculia bacterium]
MKRRRSLVQQEIKQTRPFPSKRTEALLALLRTANVLHRRVDALTQTEGLSAQQYNVLRILRGARTPLPTMEIAERLIEQAPGITRIIDRLEESGLVRREQWAGDRRCVLCQITPAGLKLLQRLDGPVDELDREMLASLTEVQLQSLIESLDAIRAANTEPT